MNRHARYTIVAASDQEVVLKDVGAPWETCLTITNDAEWVVETIWNMAYLNNGQSLFYFDSENELTELLYKGPKFIKFAPAWRDTKDRFSDLIVGE